MLKLKRFIFS